MQFNFVKFVIIELQLIFRHKARLKNGLPRTPNTSNPIGTVLERSWNGLETVFGTVLERYWNGIGTVFRTVQDRSKTVPRPFQDRSKDRFKTVPKPFQ